MLDRMEGLTGRLTSAETGLVDSQRQVAKVRALMSQMVPRMELQLLQTELDKTREHSAEAAIAAASAASASALEQQGVIERLNKLLKSQQEECAGLQDRIKVRIDDATTYQSTSWYIDAERLKNGVFAAAAAVAAAAAAAVVVVSCS